VNEQIRAHEIRLIDADGKQLGVVTMQQAKKISEEAGLDIVEVSSPDAELPVCRVMDYGKYKFQMSKRKAAAKKKQKQIQIKEIKLRIATEEFDYQVKLRNIIKFLENGDKVKITVRFRGREISHPELGQQLLNRMVVDLGDHGIVEHHPKFEGRQIVMVLGSKKK
jgi:translation initiation factor IF-3